MPIDLRRELPGYAARRGRIDVLDLAPARYLAIDGRGDPNTATAYDEALRTLYPVAYALKFATRAAGHDHVVPPLEALWWAEDLAAFTTARDKDRWQWTALLVVPPWCDDALVEQAVAATRAKGAAPRLDDLRIAELDEGRVVQTLHVGPYDDEGPLLAALHDEHLPAMGLRPTGHHHEIYLSDARRTKPERLRTILRQPVERL